MKNVAKELSSSAAEEIDSTKFIIPSFVNVTAPELDIYVYIYTEQQGQANRNFFPSPSSFLPPFPKIYISLSAKKNLPAQLSMLTLKD